ncbi:FAD-dependent oxidoreductase, partial [Sphingomonas sp. Ant H11]
MLSKEWLRSDTVPAGFELRDERWYDDNQIDLILGTRVEALDRAGGQLRLADSRCIPADRVLLATGARARRLNLPGADAANVHHLRTRADADDLRAAL